MDKLPCSTSFLMSVNFDGLKEVIDFLHKNINLLNEKINELNKKFNGFEGVKSQLNENKLKTESSLRLLGELDERMNNYSQNISKNEEKTQSNEQKINKLSEDIDKLQILINSNILNSSNNNGTSDLLNKLYDNYKEIKETIDKENNNNRNDLNQLNQKLSQLNEKINSINGSTDINNNINNFNNVNINDDNKKNNNINIDDDYKIINTNNNKNFEKSSEADNNKIYEALTKRIDILEQNLNKLYTKDVSKNYNENIPSNNRTTIIKEIALNNSGKDSIDINNKFYDLKESINKKIDDFSKKIKNLENEINNIQLNTNSNNNNYSHNVNINMPLTDIPQIINENNMNNEEKKETTDNNEDINNNENKDIDIDEKKEDEANSGIKEESKEGKSKDNSFNKCIEEIMLQINQINNKLSTDESLKKSEFNKYSQKIDIQLKDYNDKINKILQKDNLRNKLLEDMTKNNSMLTNKLKDSSSNKTDNKIMKNNNYVTYDMFDSLETKNRELILKYLSNIDISSNPSILEIHKNFEDSKNIIKNLSSKIDEIIIKNNKDNEYNYGLIDNLRKDTKNNIKKIDKEVERISLLQEEIDFFRVFLLGREEEIKYKNMTQEDKKNELLIGTSIKEEMTIHGNYLKKLSDGINKVNNRINNLNKETLALIKKDLKNESNTILEDFKSGLKESINRIENQLRDKVDKLGLDEFWNKINVQLISEMKEKIDKKEMNKNNQYLKRKIDNLESKISRTLVDTLIDLQMDEAPLVVKRNFREITGQKCASCGQHLPNIFNGGMNNNSTDFNNIGISQYKIFKSKNNGDKDKLPEIKQTIPK